MQRFLLLVCSLSLVLAGSFFSHQQGFADDAHQHSQQTILEDLTTSDESNDHAHFSPTQTQKGSDAGTLHCGSNILALIGWGEHTCFATGQIIPIGALSTRYGIWAMLDPPPPRSVSRRT